MYYIYIYVCVQYVYIYIYIYIYIIDITVLFWRDGLNDRRCFMDTTRTSALDFIKVLCTVCQRPISYLQLCIF